MGDVPRSRNYRKKNFKVSNIYNAHTMQDSVSRRVTRERRSTRDTLKRLSRKIQNKSEIFGGSSNSLLVGTRREETVKKLLKRIIAPEEPTVFSRTQYCKAIAEKFCEEGFVLVESASYLFYMESMTFLRRLFFKEVNFGSFEKEDKVNQLDGNVKEISDKDINTIWSHIHFNDLFSIDNNLNFIKFGEELKKDFDSDFEGIREQTSPSKVVHSIQYLYSKDIGKHSEELISPPFSSTKFVTTVSSLVTIVIKLKKGYFPEVIHLNLEIEDLTGAWSTSKRVQLEIIEKESKIRLSLVFEYGYQLCPLESPFLESSSILKSLEKSKAKHKSAQAEIHTLCEQMGAMNKVYDGFLKGKVGLDARISLGAIVVALFEPSWGDVTIFKKRTEAYFEQGRQRLRRVKLNDENLKYIEEILKEISENPNTDSLYDNLANKGIFPFENMSEEVDDDGIDYFVSHCWRDNPLLKFKALCLFRDQFKQNHEGRDPTIWFDICCIDQRANKVELYVKLLYVFVTASDKVLVLLSNNFLSRLWCLTELLCCWMMKTTDENALKLVVLNEKEFSSNEDITVDYRKAECTNRKAQEELLEMLQHLPGLDESGINQAINNQLLAGFNPK